MLFTLILVPPKDNILLLPEPVLLPQHSQQLAVGAFPLLVLIPAPRGCIDLGCLVVIEGPLLSPAQVSALQQDLGPSGALRTHVHCQLVILQDAVSVDKEPPEVLGVQVTGTGEVETTVQKCLDDSNGWRIGRQDEESIRHLGPRHPLCNKRRLLQSNFILTDRCGPHMFPSKRCTFSFRYFGEQHVPGILHDLPEDGGFGNSCQYNLLDLLVGELHVKLFVVDALGTDNWLGVFVRCNLCNHHKDTVDVG